MVISEYEYKFRILLYLNNKTIEFPDGTSRSNSDYFNLEDLLRTMRSKRQGMDKPTLRNHLDELTLLDLVVKREGKKQNKSQSKGEYTITKKGQIKLADMKF